MSKYSFITGSLLLIGVTVLQSTILGKFAINGVVPDFSLIILVFVSNSGGSIRGQGLGFVAGLTKDLISTSPPGFNCLISTVTGFIYGKMRGKLFLDSILLPVVFVMTATIIKEILGSFIALIFMPDSGIMFFSRKFLIELGFNAFFSPFIFALVKLLKLYNTSYKDGY